MFSILTKTMKFRRSCWRQCSCKQWQGAIDTYLLTNWPEGRTKKTKYCKGDAVRGSRNYIEQKRNRVNQNEYKNSTLCTCQDRYDSPWCYNDFEHVQNIRCPPTNSGDLCDEQRYFRQTRTIYNTQQRPWRFVSRIPIRCGSSAKLWECDLDLNE